MHKPKIGEAIIVEGRYDKNTLSQIVDAFIIETRGCGIFSDKELLDFVRKIAEKNGIIIMTDGDGAGFVIRNYLKGAVKSGRVLHAYIPDIAGKEKRKTQHSSEGKLGVEGMSRDVIIKALKDCGASFEDAPIVKEESKKEVCKADLFLLGLTGSADSSERRKVLLKKLGLPERMSTNAMLKAINTMYSFHEFIEVIEDIK